VKQTKIEDLQRHARALEKEVARLRAANLGERQRSWGTMREDRYRTLFDSIDEGFCIIEFLDGPLGDYIHIEANAAYARHTGIANVVGQKVRDMVPDAAEGWVELYRGVLSPTWRIRPRPKDFSLGKPLMRKGPSSGKSPDRAVVQT
jgi:PAS domain-containing protein